MRMAERQRFDCLIIWPCNYKQTPSLWFPIWLKQKNWKNEPGREYPKIVFVYNGYRDSGLMAFSMCSMLTDLLTYFCYIEKFSIQ